MRQNALHIARLCIVKWNYLGMLRNKPPRWQAEGKIVKIKTMYIYKFTILYIYINIFNIYLYYVKFIYLLYYIIHVILCVVVLLSEVKKDRWI